MHNVNSRHFFNVQECQRVQVDVDLPQYLSKLKSKDGCQRKYYFQRYLPVAKFWVFDIFSLLKVRNIHRDTSHTHDYQQRHDAQLRVQGLH